MARKLGAGDGGDPTLLSLNKRLEKIELDLQFCRTMEEKGEGRVRRADLKTDLSPAPARSADEEEEEGIRPAPSAPPNPYMRIGLAVRDLEGLRSYVKEQVRVRRQEVREQEDAHPEYGVQAEEQLRRTIASLSVANSRGARSSGAAASAGLGVGVGGASVGGASGASVGGVDSKLRRKIEEVRIRDDQLAANHASSEHSGGAVSSKHDGLPQSSSSVEPPAAAAAAAAGATRVGDPPPHISSLLDEVFRGPSPGDKAASGKGSAKAASGVFDEPWMSMDLLQEARKDNFYASQQKKAAPTLGAGRRAVEESSGDDEETSDDGDDDGEEDSDGEEEKEARDKLRSAEAKRSPAKPTAPATNPHGAKPPPPSKPASFSAPAIPAVLPSPPKPSAASSSGTSQKSPAADKDTDVSAKSTKNHQATRQQGHADDGTGMLRVDSDSEIEDAYREANNK